MVEKQIIKEHRLGRIICFFGMHDWKYTGDKVDIIEKYKYGIKKTKKAKFICLNCGKEKYFEPSYD